MEEDHPVQTALPPSTHYDHSLMGWQQQPQLGLLHRFADVVEQLPLPCPDETTSSVVSSPDPVQLQELLSQPSVLQGVQHALASTRMQHIVPRQTTSPLEPSLQDPILSVLLQGCPDLLRRTAPPRGLATPGPLHADSLDQPEAQQGVEDHLISYTDPVTAAPHAMPKTGGRARPKEAATSERKAKRKRAARPKGSEEEGEGYEVQVALDPAAAAGQLTGILTGMLGAQEGKAAEEQEEGEDGGEAAVAPAHAAVGRLPPAKVQMLSGMLMSARSQGYLSKVPAAVLQHLLRTLHQFMLAGAAPVIPNSREKSLELTLVMDALEAAVAATYILSTPDLPPEVYMEEVVQSVVQLAQHHMQVNVLAVLDDRYHRLWRPSEPASSLQTQGIFSTLKKGGRTPKTPRASKASPHLPSSYLDLLLPPLQQLLVLMSDVLTAVKVDASQVLPLVRIMIGCLSVDALPRVFQVKAAGLAVAVFGALPEQRAVLLAELLSSTGLLGASSAATGGGGGAASARAPPREFLAQDEPPIQIQVSTALLLQLIQATAQLPPIEEPDLQLIQDSCKVPIGWCDRLWVTLLEKLPAAKHTSLDVKTFLDHFVQDLLAVQHTPEWPGAQLLLRRLVMALNTSKGLQHPESAVRLACIDLLGTITSAFMADCKQAEEEQEKVEALLSASGYDADAEREGGAFLGDEDKARVEALQRLLLGALAARPSSGTRHTARTLIVQQMLLQRAVFEQQQPPVMSSQPQDLMPPMEPPQPPTRAKKGRKGQTAAAAAAAAQAEAEREKELRRESALAQQGSALLAEFHALLTAPPRVAVGTDASSTASISRWLLLNSAMGRGRGSFLLWLVNAGSAVGKGGGGVGAGYQATSTAERSRAVKALGSAIEMDERVLGHVDVQAAVCAALEDDAVSVREAAVELLGRHISHSPELAMTYFDLIGRASNDAGLSVRKRAVKVLWDCCVQCGSAAAATDAYMDTGAPAFTRACEAVSLIMARAADAEDSMRKLATGLCAGLLFSSGSHPAVPDADAEAAGGFQGASLAAAAKGSPSARAMLLAEVCDLVYRSDAPTSIKLPLPSDHSLVVVLKAILGQSSTSQPIVGGGGALAAQAAAAQQGAADLARALLEKIMELQEAAAAASAALDAALTGTSSGAHPAAAAAAASSAAAGAGAGGPPDAGSPQRQAGAVPPSPFARPQGDGEAASACAQQGDNEQEAISRGARSNTHTAAAATVAAAEASLGRAELQQLQCLLALHALCAADVGVLVQAHGGAAYFARGVAPYFKELVTVGDKSSTPSKRARSERVICAMHIVAALAGRAEGGQARLEAALVKDLVSDLQLIIGRHLFVSVVSSAVQCMCALSRPHPNLVTQQIVGLAARYHLMLENDLNGGITETSPYRGMYPKLLFILGNFCRYAAHILDRYAGMQVEVPSASTTSAGPTQAVSCRACLLLFLDFFLQGCSAQPGGVTPKVTEAALQAMGLLFTARPELMWEERGCLALLEDQLKPTSLLAHKARVLQNLIDLLKAEEEGLVIRQKKVEEEYLAQPSFGTLTAPTSLATTTSAAPPAAAASKSIKTASATASHGRARAVNGSSNRGRGAGRGGRSIASSSSVANGTVAPKLERSMSDARDGEGGAALEDGGQGGDGGAAQAVAKRNGEGDVSSISSDVVRKLWPSILQAATDTGVQAQGAGSSMAGGAGVNAVALQDVMRSAATVRRRVLELIEVAHRGGLTAPWDAIPALVALSTDPILDTSARALRVLKQCCEHHAPLVPAKLAAGIINTYRFQMSLTMASSAVASGDSGGTRRPPRPPTPKELLGGGSLPEALGQLWSGVVATDRTRKAKFLSALLKPFEEASCLAMQGASKSSDVHLLAFCCAAAAELPYRKADEPLTLLTTINSIVVRRGHPALDAIKQAMLAAPQSPSAQQRGGQQQQEQAQQQQDQQQQQQQGQSTAKGQAAQVPYEVAAKASLAVSMLLLLKKFLREAYRLVDERVAAYAGPGGTVLASSRKVEEKAAVARDARIQLMLYDDVLDMSAPGHAPSSKAARKLYKTIKYLLSEDAANYRPPPSLNGELDNVAAGGEDAGTAAEEAEGEEGGSLPAVARSAKPAAGRGRKRQPQQQKRKSRKKPRGHASSEEEEEEEEEEEGKEGADAGQDVQDANRAPSKPVKRGRHAHAGGAAAGATGRRGGGDRGGGAPRRAGSRQRKKKSGKEDFDEEEGSE